MVWYSTMIGPGDVQFAFRFFGFLIPPLGILMGYINMPRADRDDIPVFVFHIGYRGKLRVN